MFRYLIPLVVFVVVAGFLWVGLKLNPSVVPSPYIDKPAPEFSLPLLNNPELQFAKQDMLGRVWLMNVWGSWCPACATEHPLLVQYARSGQVPILGFNWRDDPAAAKAWLAQRGDPYEINIMDRDSKSAIDFGVYGAPETFVIDKQGVIRHKVIGPITPNHLQECLIPLVQKLQAAAEQDVVTRDVVKGCG
jgi:cytochrome c biogenesis protein CcmG/thiol:disulfide interchange protein DsbE